MPRKLTPSEVKAREVAIIDDHRSSPNDPGSRATIAQLNREGEGQGVSIKSYLGVRSPHLGGKEGLLKASTILNLVGDLLDSGNAESLVRVELRLG